MKDIEKMSIDDKIEYWHIHETGNGLREFLGMTEQEYFDFCIDGIKIKNDNFCILCGEMIPEGRQVCLSCENKSIHKAVYPKYNVGDVVYCYSCFNGELFPEKEPYVIYEVVVNTSAFGTNVFYRVERTIDTVQTYDIFSERLCFETYEKCAHYCSAHNEL